MPSRFPVLVLLIALLLPGCAPPGGVQRAMTEAQGGELEAARLELESQRARQPGSAGVRLALGTVYYRIARDALERRGDEARYLAYFEQAVDELVTAAEIDPRHPDPHLYLAAVDLYRGDLDSSLRGLQNTRRLRGSGIDYTNLGELYVYRAELAEARRMTLLGLRRGAGAGPVTFNQMLIHWREGDLRGAERDFKVLWKNYPEMLSRINMAPVLREPDSFDEFASNCCGSPACGPYLEEACGKLGLAVQQRELSEQSALKELQIEMEKARRLREIYSGRKDVQVEVEEPKAAGSPE